MLGFYLAGSTFLGKSWDVVTFLDLGVVVTTVLTISLFKIVI